MDLELQTSERVDYEPDRLYLLPVLISLGSDYYQFNTVALSVSAPSGSLQPQH